jgi:hypothetical protein
LIRQPPIVFLALFRSTSIKPYEQIRSRPGCCGPGDLAAAAPGLRCFLGKIPTALPALVRRRGLRGRA